MATKVEVYLGRIAEPVDSKFGFAKCYLLGEDFMYQQKVAAETPLEYNFNLGNGTKEQFSVKTTKTIIAKWLPLGLINRQSSPELGGGETVLILRFAGLDEYYYIPMFFDIDLRRNEVVEYLYAARKPKKNTEGSDSSGNPDTGSGTGESTDDDDSDPLSGSYRMIIDTVNQQVVFSTSKVNGERSEYRLMFDTKIGRFLLANCDDEYIMLDSSDAEDPEEKPSALKARTAGELSLKVGKASYLLQEADKYELVGNDSWNYIKGTTMTYVEGDKTDFLKGNYDSVIKGNTQIRASGEYGIYSKGNVILQSDGDIGITSSTGKLNLFAGDELAVTGTKVSIVAPAVSVTGQFAAASITVGSAPSATITPMTIQPNEQNWDKFKEAMEKVIKKNEIPTTDEAKDEEEEKKEEQKEEEPEKPNNPGNVDGTNSDNNAIFNMPGKVEFSGDQGVTIKSAQNTEIKSDLTTTIEGSQSTAIKGGTVSITGTAGVKIEGGGLELTQVLMDTLTDLSNGLTQDLAMMMVLTPTGPGSLVPILANTLMSINTAVTRLTTFKGSARSRTISDEEISYLSSKLKKTNKE